jgi:hypothetical protein
MARFELNPAELLAANWRTRANPALRPLLPRKGWELSKLGGEPCLMVEVGGARVYLYENGGVHVFTADYMAYLPNTTFVVYRDESEEVEA